MSEFLLTGEFLNHEKIIWRIVVEILKHQTESKDYMEDWDQILKD